MTSLSCRISLLEKFALPFEKIDFLTIYDSNDDYLSIRGRFNKENEFLLKFSIRPLF
jgi:hypothetical protein